MGSKRVVRTDSIASLPRGMLPKFRVNLVNLHFIRLLSLCKIPFSFVLLWSDWKPLAQLLALNLEPKTLDECSIVFSFQYHLLNARVELLSKSLQ